MEHMEQMDDMDDTKGTMPTQVVAQGDQCVSGHAKDVEAEVAAHGDTPMMVGGHGQGGAGH